MDGEVRGEEHSSATEKEGHHVRNPRQPRNGHSLPTQLSVLFKEGGPPDSYYT